MNQQILQITTEPIGVGKERACYLHPRDSTKAVKVQKGEFKKQTQRELKFYRTLQRRKMNNFKHIPQFYGKVQTNLGEGFIVDLIKDFDGNISRSLYWFIEQGYPISEFNPYLEDLKQYLLQNLIVFNNRRSPFNLLFKRVSDCEARIVVIDGLGDHAAINWFDVFGYFARRKINRRWARFFSGLQDFSAEILRGYNGSPKMLDSAYRKAK
jgi:hypothetical protein